ncbi:MAG: hypothetical protein BGO82_03985 [Devosia sp. 67-54]|uniref:hypothetical protein n=1 Tax=unclassified Devosia TaxID=196773 RepID=UPI00095926FE|nr:MULTISPECIES: hypothetical protein [unclassified Devosia]MBN9305637.1 hypothetical protein [Devosia sp.]OJX19203.1 MAG: hypothetical protein BGO82_03985 [Devosia sp. 67-54]
MSEIDMTSARQRALGAVRIGDVIYGLSGAGNEKLLLVYDVSDDSIFARHITSQTSARFDRADGETKSIPSGGSCRIVSTAALPASRHEIAIGLDHKMRTGKAHPDFVLSKAEIDLLLTSGDFFRAHLLPER